MPMFKSDARNFSFDLTDNLLAVETSTFDKVSPERPTYVNVHLIAISPSADGSVLAENTAARIAIQGVHGEVVKVLGRALATMAGADPIRTRKALQVALQDDPNFNMLEYALGTQYEDMTHLGHCSNCSQMAVAQIADNGLVSGWVHLGGACDPTAAQGFVVGPKFTDPDIDVMAETLRALGYQVTAQN